MTDGPSSCPLLSKIGSGSRGRRSGPQICATLRRRWSRSTDIVPLYREALLLVQRVRAAIDEPDLRGEEAGADAQKSEAKP